MTEGKKALDEASHIGADTDLRSLSRSFQGYLEEQDLCETCSLEVAKQGEWYVLKGQVDSHRTRAELFGLVPEHDGARWIVDELHVGKPRSSNSNS